MSSPRRSRLRSGGRLFQTEKKRGLPAAGNAAPPMACGSPVASAVLRPRVDRPIPIVVAEVTARRVQSPARSARMSPHRQPRPERTAFSLAGGHARIRASSCSWQRERKRLGRSARGSRQTPFGITRSLRVRQRGNKLTTRHRGPIFAAGDERERERGRKPSLGGGRRGDRKDLEGEEPALPRASELLAPPPPLPQAFSLLAACPLRSDQADLRGRRFQRTISLRRKKFPAHRDVRGVAR